MEGTVQQKVLGLLGRSIMTMRDEREIKREREGGKNGEKGEKGG